MSLKPISVLFSGLQQAILRRPTKAKHWCNFVTVSESLRGKMWEIIRQPVWLVLRMQGLIVFQISDVVASLRC